MKSLPTLIVLLGLSCSVAAQEQRLNLLLITADDMNGDSAGWMGNPLKTTPHLDAFSITAHQFVNHHVTAPICQPSRSAFMTGRVPHASGAFGFDPVREGVPSLVTILRDHGYFTGVIDKHVHMEPDSVFPWDRKLQGSGKNPPLRRQHMDEMLAAAEESGKPFFINANITDPHRPFPGSAQSANRRGGRRPAMPDDDKADDDQQPRRQSRDRQARRAARSAGAASPEELGLRVVKEEEVRPPRFLENLPEIRKEAAEYETAIVRVDASFAAIMDALREAGRESDTIVVFFSDHGISMPFSKATVYRNGTWSPLLIRIPGGGIPQVRHEFVSSVDLAPTLLELMKIDRPDGMNGRSWVELLRGGTQIDRDFVVTHVNTTSSGKSQAQRCIRSASHALLFHAWVTGEPVFKVEAMSGLTFKALEQAAAKDARIAARVAQYQTGEPLMFFDVLADPDERRNLIRDPRQKDEIERWAALLIDHMQRTNDPLLREFQKALDLWRMRS